MSGSCCSNLSEELQGMIPIGEKKNIVREGESQSTFRGRGPFNSAGGRACLIDAGDLEGISLTRGAHGP